MAVLKRSIRCLNQTQSCFIALLLAATLFCLRSSLGSPQVESIASGNVICNKANANTSMELYQNLVVEGDIAVENGTYLIENTTFNLTGKITASNDATILIRNATLFLTTQGQTIFRDGVVLTDNSKLVTENATIVLKCANPIEWSYITVSDESTANITDSKLYGNALIIGRQNSRINVNRSVLKKPGQISRVTSFTVLTEDNSTATIQNSELDIALARGNSSIYISDSNIQSFGILLEGNALMEIENSLVRLVEWGGWSTLRILNSTISSIEFTGLALTVRDSRVIYDLSSGGSSTVWLTNVSAGRVRAESNSTVWLINSYAGIVETRDQGKVYVGWQLPLFGTVAFPHNWLPILQTIALLAALVLIIALLVVLNRRWKRRQMQKLEQRSQASINLDINL